MRRFKRTFFGLIFFNSVIHSEDSFPRNSRSRRVLRIRKRETLQLWNLWKTGWVMAVTDLEILKSGGTIYIY